MIKDKRTQSYTVSDETLFIDNVNNKIVTRGWSSPNNKIACELFMKPSSNRPHHCIVIASRFNQHNVEPNSPFPGWFLQIVGNNLSLGIGNGKTWKSVKTNKTILNGTWYHVAFSLDNDKNVAELYLRHRNINCSILFITN